jgi:hypothetical protein
MTNAAITDEQGASFAALEFRPVHDGKAAEVHFANGYGASVLQRRGSYGHDQGLYELAVLADDGLCYDTPITDDVLGHLSEERVTEALRQIAALPDRVRA